MSILLRPLRQRTFALLWGATLLSNLGFWIQDLTMGWLIAGLTDSPSLVALVPAAGMLPTFLFSLPAGAFGDAVDRRRFLITVQVLFVVLLVVFAVLVGLGRLEIWGVIGFAFLHGTLAAVSAPTRQAILPSIVDAENVRGAVMLSAVGYNGSRAVGPMLGGLILAAFGPVAAIASYAVSCLAVGAVIYAWRNPHAPAGRLRIYAQSGEGLRYVWSNPGMRLSLLLTALYFLAIAPLWAFAPLIGKQFAQGDTRIFGLFLMALGLGAVTGGLNRKLTSQTRFGFVLAAGSVFSAVALAIIALSHSMPLTLAGFFIAGLGWISVSGGINSHMLLAARADYRSRVIAMVMIVFSGGLGLGSFLWGQLAQHLGLAESFLLGAVALAALGMAAYLIDRTAQLSTPA
ncbi:MFS transporter [Novosphingobium soli]|uniref:MFS transporter n=1 Tax=Novosphingobium soli TaxID=574956 RepID=A0ABV6CV41_9SPHN